MELDGNKIMTEFHYTDECILRHKRQDEVEEKINQIHEIICGGLHPEQSLSTKVNEMWKENQSVKNFIKGCIVSLVVLIFWCGYQFAILQGCISKLEKLEVKLESISK